MTLLGSNTRASGPPNSRRWPRLARYFAYCAAALIAIVIAAALILPEILDSPAVRAEIQRKLSEVVQGEVAWDDLSIRILPSPRGVLRKARVELPGIASVRAEQIDARLRFWPLLRGRAEITTVSVVRPEIRIDIAASPPVDDAKKEEKARGPDPFVIYRSVMEPIARVFRQFAPDTVFTVEDAIVDVRAPGMSPIELRDLSVRARSGLKGLDLDLTAASNFWSRLKLSAHIEFSDLAAKASLDVTDVRPQGWLDHYLAESTVRVEVPALNLRAQASYDARASLESSFDVSARVVNVWQDKEHFRVTDTGLKGKVSVDAQEIAVGLEEVKLGASRLQGVKLRYEMKSSALAGTAEFDLDLNQGMDYTRRLAPEKAGAALGWFRQVTGRAQGSVKLDFGQPGWSVDVDIRKSDAAVQIRDLPGPVRLAGGTVHVDRRGVKVDRVAMSMPAGKVLLSALRYSFENGTTVGGAGFDLDLPMSLELARRLLPENDRAAIARIQSISGRAHGNVKFDLGQRNWSVGVDVHKTDAAVRIQNLPDPVKISGGSVESNPRAVKIDRVALAMRDTRMLMRTLSYSLDDGTTAGEANFDLDLAQAMDIARRLLPEENRAALAVIQSASGRAQGTTKLAFGRKDWSVGLDIQKADAQVQVQGLPAPAGLASGSVHATAGAVKVDRAVVTLLDAKATASTAISFRDEVRVQGSVAEGSVGEKFLEWVWRSAEAPPHLLLKTPINVTAQQFAWGPKGALDVQATARFPAGQDVAVDLGWTPGALNVRRAVIKDGRSDAVIAVRSVGPRVEGGFSGSLYGSSISAALRSVIPREGSVSGKIRFAFDRDRPRDATAEGNLKGESLDLSWLVGQPLKIERIDLAADGASLRIREAAVNWAEQRATIRGDLKQGTDGPVIDAQLDSPGIDVDAILKAGDGAKKPPAGKPEPSQLWPLPVTGQFSLRSNFLQRGRYRIAPIAATLALQPERARLELQQAQLCGISLPMTVEATPGGLSASAKVTAQKQQLQQAAHCLTDQHVLITGEFDLQANVNSRGKLGELARNLEGSVTADMRNGSIMKFALLGNILSLKGITTLFKEGAPRIDEKGFSYHSIAIKGRFAKGRFNVDESAFRSDALGLVATGWVSLTEPQSRLTVLVAPFGRVDQLARSIPLLGYIFGGAFTSVPVGVSGDIRDPLVIPLGPGAITSELTGIFERTLKLPVKLIAPLEGGREAQPPDGK